jgi:hypothetical protein
MAVERKRDTEGNHRRADAAKLKALIRDVLGELVEPEDDTIVLDGVSFRMIDYPEQGPQLVILRLCKTCGKPTPSRWLANIEDVGEALEENEGGVECRTCREKRAASTGLGAEIQAAGKSVRRLLPRVEYGPAPYFPHIEMTRAALVDDSNKEASLEQGEESGPPEGAE